MNLMDYLDWRGDLSFDASPLNEVDALIFSWLSYYPFEKLKGDPESLTLHELADLHESENGPISKVNLTTNIDTGQTATWLLRRAADTDRFRDIKVTDLSSVTDADRGMQFAAMSFLADADLRVIAYRGTDGSIAGWKEDCYLAFSGAVPAQMMAAEYFEKVNDGREIVLCGHSKGGNLAMFAALKAPEMKLGEIRAVYNFDGPGFCFELEKDSRYEKIHQKIVTIVPESSIVGMLLNHEEDYQIVESQMASILQHDALFWKVIGNHFVYADKRNPSSVFVDNTLREWIAGASLDERKEFVDAMFSIVENTGAREFSEIPEKITRSGFRTLTKTSLTARQKKVITRLLSNLFSTGGSQLYEAATGGDVTR